MKQLIILTASVLLGIFLFNMIAGSSDDSMYSAAKRLWQQEAQLHTMQDGRTEK